MRSPPSLPHDRESPLQDRNSGYSPNAFKAPPIRSQSQNFRPKFAPKAPIRFAKPLVDRWGGQDLNLRPTDYESVSGRFGCQRKREKRSRYLQG